MRLSKKRKSRAGLWALLSLTGVCGCASGPELVYVDLSAVEPLSVNVAPSAASGHEPREIGSTGSILALEERRVFIGSAQDKASDALEVYLQTQAEAAESVLNGLRDAYMAEVDSAQRDGEQLILEEYKAWLDTEFDELHAEFVKHAKLTGPLRYELSWKVGFPDPDPGSLATSTDEIEMRKLESVKGVRERLNALDSTFRSLVAERLGRLEREQESKMRALEAEMNGERAAALQRAQKEADAVTAQAFAILQRSALDPEAQLPAVPSVESAVNSELATRWTWQTSDPPSESQEQLRAQLAVYLRVHGFQLTEQHGEGRDVTQEFVVWRRIYLAGR